MSISATCTSLCSGMCWLKLQQLMGNSEPLSYKDATHSTCFQVRCTEATEKKNVMGDFGHSDSWGIGLSSLHCSMA